jgi:dynein heavy chain, axonemal
VKVVVEEEEKIVNAQADQIRETKHEADKILEEALPTLQAASDALNTLNRTVCFRTFFFSIKK